MQFYKKLLLAGALISSVGFFVGSTIKEARTPEAVGDIFYPGYVKHCPIVDFGEVNGISYYMTQQCEHCGSDFVTASYHEMSGGCIECGWAQDCVDPIYFSTNPDEDPDINNPQPPEGDGGEDPIYEDPTYEDPTYEDPTYEDPTYEDPTYEDPTYEDPYWSDTTYDDYYYEETYDDYTSVETPTQDLCATRKAIWKETGLPFVSGRHFVATTQEQYVPQRFGEPGDSRNPRGQLKLESHLIQHSSDSDFVARVVIGGSDVRYFRMFEMEVASQSAEQQYLRFGQELDPASLSADINIRDARVVKSMDQRSHRIVLLSGPKKEFVVTSVLPILEK